MSILVLTKSADCGTEVVEEVVVITQPTQFTISTSSNVNATIHFAGAFIGMINQSNPQLNVFVVGDYTVRVVGKCNSAFVYTDDIIEPPSEISGGGPTPICASTDGRLILIDTSVSPVVLIELNGDPIGDGATAVACSGGSGGGGGPVPICASDDGRLILIDTSVVPSVITELDGTPIGGGVTAVSCGAPAATFPDQTHVLSHGTDINVPAGAKSVVITRLTGTVVVDGGFSLGSTPLPSAISYDASEVVGARGLLPAITMAGGTWQWSALLPITEE